MEKQPGLSLRDVVIALDEDDTLLQASEGWAAIFGEPPTRELGAHVLETVLGGLLRGFGCVRLGAHLRAVRSGVDAEPVGLEVTHPRLGARILEARAHRDPMAPSRVTLVLRDATHTWRQLRRVAENERRFRTVAEASRDVVTETDFASGRFTYVSAASEPVLGYPPSELVGTLGLALHHPEDRDGFVADVGGGAPGRPFDVRPHRLRRADGSWVWIEATGLRYRGADGRPRVVGVARDITPRLEAEKQRLDLEAQLQRSQRLDSLGVLAGGIAHDFNNLLTPILGSASADTTGDAADREQLLRRLEIIHASAKRAKALTSQMLTYAGRGASDREPIALAGMVEEMALLLETTAGRSAKIGFDLDADLPAVVADANEMGQILMNLVVNASEAIDRDAGRIDVRVFGTDLDRAFLDGCVLGETLEAGRYACLEVSDDGCGMDVETLERVVEPFYTTKFSGRGLGLAVVLGIIRRHGGALRIRSEAGAGACFSVLLPFAPAGVRPAPRKPAPPLVTRPCAPGSLLVVDDDDGARDLTSTLLRRAGFEVHEAVDGAEAVERFRELRGRLQGVVLDSTMPGLSGAGVVAAIREIDPSVRVLLVSGYTADREGAETQGGPGTGFLQKPFEAEELIDAVDRFLLAGRDAPGA